MQLPQNIDIAFVDLGTNPVANIDQTQNVTPALGATLRTRVWVINYSPNSVSHPAHIWMSEFVDSGFAGRRYRMAGAYPDMHDIVIPGGWPLVGRLQIVFRASIAGPMFYRATAMYTVERV